MKIKSVHIQNFRQFRDFKIDFEINNNEKNITVIRAANSTGKTTFMQAIKWCLFGDEAVELERASDLLNRDLLKEVRYSESRNAHYRVVLEVVEDGSSVIINRTQNLIVTQSRTTKQSMLVTLKYKDDDGQTIVTRNSDREREQAIQKKINSLLSMNMINYFLFDGERIENLSSDGTAGKREIRDAISAVSSLPILNNSIETLTALSRDIRKQKANSVSNEEYTYVTSQITELEDRIEENKKKMEDCTNNKETYIHKLDEVNKRLSSMADVSQFQERRKYLEKENMSLTERNKKLFKEIQSDYLKYSTARYIYLLKRKFQKLNLEQSEDIKSIPFMEAKAIDAIIDNGTCICGTILGERHIEKLEEQRVHQPPESNEAMMKDYELAVIKETSNINSYVGIIKNYVEEYNKNFSIISENNEELSEIDEDISKLPKDEIKKLNENRKKYEYEINILNFQIDEAIADKNECSEKLQRLKYTMEQLSAKLKFNEVLNIKDEILKKSLESLRFRKNKDEKELRKNVEKYANKHFKEIITKNKHIQIDDKFNLKVLEEDNTESSISSGESVAVSISIILSIIDTFRENLSKSKNQDTDLLSEKDFFVVMDGPFAMLDQYFSKKISTKLSDSIEQIILLTNDNQYNDSIKDAFRTKTSNEFLLNIPPEDREDSIYTEDLEEVRI